MTNQHGRKYRQWSVDSPEIRALFEGLYSSGYHRYFYIRPDGSHILAHVTEKLRGLGMSVETASGLLKTGKELGLIQPGEYKKRKRKPSLVTNISVNDSRVQAVLAGVSRGGTRTYYRDGQTFPLREELSKALGVSRETASKVMKLAEMAGMIPMAAKPEKPKGAKQPKVAKPKPEPEAAAASTNDQDAEGYVFADDDGPEDEPATPSFAICRKQLPSRYQLVTSKSRTRTFYGCFDSKQDMQWSISEDRSIALAEVKRLNAQDKAQQHVPYYLRAA